MPRGERECEGWCEGQRIVGQRHVGQVTRVRVEGFGVRAVHDYCETAIAIDRGVGFMVTEVLDAD